MWVSASPQVFQFLKNSLFGMMSAPCEIDVKIQKVENRKNGTIKDKQGNTYKAPIFMVSGIKAKMTPIFFIVGRRRHQGLN